jgi:hypothetical protein
MDKYGLTTATQGILMSPLYGIFLERLGLVGMDHLVLGPGVTLWRVKNDGEFISPSVKENTMKGIPCECCDPGCPVHPGEEDCTKRATTRLRRVDMEDETGEYFCRKCADDALDSGVFTTFYDR